MSECAPQRVRTFEVYVIFGTDTSAREAIGRIARRARKTTLHVSKEWIEDNVLRMQGTYTVHGNGPYDLRRMIQKGLRGLGRGNDGRQGIVPRDIHVVTSAARVVPCNDLDCDGCFQHRKKAS